MERLMKILEEARPDIDFKKEDNLIDGEVLEGDFPKKQMKLLIAWMAIHEDELNANWKMLSEGEGYFKIAPLSQEVF